MKNRIITILTLKNLILIIILFIIMLTPNGRKELSGVDIFNSNLLRTVEVKSSSENKSWQLMAVRDT